MFPGCGANRQSPINIDTHRLVYQTFSLVLYNYQQSYDTNVANNGDLAQVSFETTPTQSRPFVELSDTGDTRYILEHLQFNWGKQVDGGSEHSVDGKSAAAEIFFTHFNQDYGNTDEALFHPNGIVIMSVMADISDNDNPNLKPLIDAVSRIAPFNTSIDISADQSFYISSMLPMYMYKYHGSITIPPCHESVTWIIFENRISISTKQLNTFRLMQWEFPIGNETHILDNCRPIQPLTGRSVFSSKQHFI
ncbi:carbonic anhydrase 7-like [Oppia nitens]|uniref:carbonic anhydrase 7-like n=1 Tax=Oppia nitens TaxID=1686743 RepID=UPI0023DCBA74|nr:carbonic anhydrase 7-like [Oppia nitens]